MTSWLTLSVDVRQKLTFKENSSILAGISTKQWIKIYFFSQKDADLVAGDRARTLMSRMETSASSLIIFFIYVDYHKQRSISVCFIYACFNVPVNNFSVMLRRSHLFLGITSTFGEKMSLAQGNNTPTRPRIEPGSPDPESDALTTRPVRSPFLYVKT